MYETQVPASTIALDELPAVSTAAPHNPVSALARKTSSDVGASGSEDAHGSSTRGTPSPPAPAKPSRLGTAMVVPDGDDDDAGDNGWGDGDGDGDGWGSDDLAEDLKSVSSPDF